MGQISYMKTPNYKILNYYLCVITYIYINQNGDKEEFINKNPSYFTTLQR